MSSLAVDFVKAFKSDTDLIDAVRRLISVMPDASNVLVTRESGGSNQIITFFATGLMGKNQLHACLMCRSAIGVELSAQDVSSQIIRCFSQRQAAFDRQEYFVSSVILASPHPCSGDDQRTIELTVGQQAGGIHFLCGEELVERFNNLLPDFLLFNSSALNLYISSITRNVFGKDPVHFLLKNQQLLAGELDSLQNRYVDQNFTKTIREYSCSIDPYRYTKDQFRIALSLADVRGMSTEVRALVSLAETEILNGEDGVGLLLNRFQSLELFAQALPSSWLEAFDGFRKTPDYSLTHLQKRGDITLPLGQRFYAAWEEEIRLVHEFATEVESKNKRISKFLDSSSLSRKSLPSDAIYNISTDVDDLARFAPSLFFSGRDYEASLDKRSLLSGDKNLLITAPAGYGKTSFCRIHAMRDALALSEDKSNRVPVYVSLHSMATEKIHDRTFFELPESKALLGVPEYSELRWTFYLDGLDEVADKDQRLSILAVAKSLVEQIPLARVIITSRDYLGGTSLGWLSRVELAGLDDAGISDLAMKWLPDLSDLQSFNDQIERTGAFRKLMRIPLMATLILAVFKKRKSLPTSKIALYTTFTELLCGGWDYVKSVNRNSEYGKHEKIAVLTRFAGILHFNKLRHGVDSYMRQAVSDVSPAYLDTLSNLIREMIEDGLIQRSGKNLVFNHLSFQEFLAAKELGDPSGERNNVVLLDFLRGDDWWREVLSFYVAAHNRPDETERWIRRAAEKVEQGGINCRPREYFLLACIEESCPGWESKLLKQQLEARVKDGRFRN